MDLTHQLTPMLKSLRLSGILETLELRNRTAIVAERYEKGSMTLTTIFRATSWSELPPRRRAVGG
jgi:hypothetical protein